MRLRHRVERRDAGEITLVEEINPFRVYRLNVGLLGECRRNQRGHEGNHRCNPAHDSWLPTWREYLRFCGFSTRQTRDRRLLGAFMPGLPSAQRAQRLGLLAKFMKRVGDPR